MKLSQLLGQRERAGDVGIELEIEGKDLPYNGVSDFWNIVPDGSLRDGGMEYVLSQPIAVKEVPKALRVIAEAFKANRTKPSYSFRTSTHVHVNMQRATYNQVLSTILVSVALEAVLTNFCDARRHANRFCLRVADAEEIMECLKGLFKHAHSGGSYFWRNLDQNRLKYSAMNLVTLKKYGSLEFRLLEGTQDWQKIDIWANGLVNIRDYAMKFETPNKVIDRLEKVGGREFAKEAFGDVFKSFDYDRLEFDVAQSVSISYDLFLTSLSTNYEVKKENLPDIEGVDWELVRHSARIVSTMAIQDAVRDQLILRLGTHPETGREYWVHKRDNTAFYTYE